MRKLLTTIGLAASIANSVHAQTGMTGFVREDSTGKPIPGADITIEALKRSTRSDASGHYLLVDLSDGARMVTVRKVGYEQTGFMVQISKGELKTKDFTLSKSAPTPTLDTMKVSAPSGMLGRALAAFEEHRAKGFGAFIDSTELRKRSAASLADVMQSLQGVKVFIPPLCRPLGQRVDNCVHSPTVRVAISSSTCAMTIIMDNTVISRGGLMTDMDPITSNMRFHSWPSAFDLTSINAGSLAAVEIYRRTSEIPQDLTGVNEECGAVYLWTKR